MNERVEAFVGLIGRASTVLPGDAIRALEEARKKEDNSTAGQVLDVILENVRMARENSTPICQDTGTPLFFVTHPPTMSTRALEEEIREAVREATRRSFLRPNAVDPVTGKNSGDNTGRGFPHVEFTEAEDNNLRVSLLLKGGGSENVGAQYKLPDGGLEAGRDLEGVRRCVIDAAQRAQGKGCAPGVLGVCIGGDRGSGYLHSKEVLLRPIQDRNDDPEIAALEERLIGDINSLGIGPMGLGGRTTVLGVKVGVIHRLPACYFVTISYLCWAARRHTMVIRSGEAQYD
jgi:fumarate hydratase class I